MEHIILLSAVFFVLSIFFSMIGMGGGTLYVPILLFAGFSIKQAPAISLILILGTALPALFNFFKYKKTDWKLALAIEPATNIMAFLGGYYSSLIPAKVLKILLIIILVIAGTLMLKKKKITAKNLQNSKPWHWHREFNGSSYTINMPLILFAGACIGTLSGMIGMTGGIIKLPIMVLLCGVPMDIAVATSTVMVAITAFSGLIGHAIQSPVAWHTGFVLAFSAMFGGFLGSKLSLNVNKVLLKKIFGIVVWLIAIKFTLQL